MPGGRTTDGGTAGILFEAGKRRRGGLIETTDTDEVIRLRLLRVIRDLGVYVRFFESEGRPVDDDTPMVLETFELLWHLPV